MGDDVLAKNIRRYILRGGEDADIDVDVDTDMDKDADIDTIEITKLDYRTIFDRSTVENSNHVSLMRKFFEVKKHLKISQQITQILYNMKINGKNYPSSSV